MASTVADSIKVTVDLITEKLTQYPILNICVDYVKRSYQHDPARVALEILLLFFALKYVASKKFDPNKAKFDLTPKEIDELVDEWEPEPLVVQPSNNAPNKLRPQPPVITSAIGLECKLDDGSSVSNWSCPNFLGLYNHPQIKKAAIAAVKYYGVGTCGPSGFYGTLDVHLELESKLAKLLELQASIIYPQSFSAASSVIPSFSKRGDIIVADEGVNVAIVKGIEISKSQIYWFKHNDMEDLERILEQIDNEHNKLRKSLTRRFIIVEGLSANYGDIVPLKSILALKARYKYRLIVDESLSIGALGPRGLGIADYFGISRSELDIIIGSFSGAFGAAGGFSAGSEPVVDHQRLSSQAYCFSASLPALLTKSVLEAIDMLDQNPTIMHTMRLNIKLFRELFCNPVPNHFTLIGDKDSPLLYLQCSTRLDNEEGLIDAVVEQARGLGILLAKASRIRVNERLVYPPSIKICISAGFDTAQIDQFAVNLRSAIEQAKREQQLIHY